MDKPLGVIVIGIAVYWFISNFEPDAARRSDVGNVLAPVGEIVIESKVKWAKTVGQGLKLAGTLLEIEYFLADGQKARSTHSIEKNVSRKLKTGDRITVRDGDGIARECVLVEVTPAPAWPSSHVCVRYHLHRTEVRYLFPEEARDFAQTLARTPGIPYWIRPIRPDRCEVTYGPLPVPCEMAFERPQDAQAFTNHLRSVGFDVTVVR